MAKRSISTGVAVVALILNLFIPGLGTIIWGNKQDGKNQLILLVVGIVLSWLPLINVFSWIVYAIAWIWALVSSIRIIQSAK